MLALKLLVLVLLAATQLQLISTLDPLPKTLGLLPPTPPIDYMVPDSLKQSMEGMQPQVDPEWLEQAIANYTKPNRPTVRFFLYCNRRNRNEVHELYTGDTQGLDKTCFVKNATVKILAHGYGQTHEFPCAFPQSTKDAYLEYGICPNIILLDYTGTTGYWILPLAAYLGVPEARDQGAAFIEWLFRINAVELDSIHPIGFSLGAQVVGAICQKVYEVLGYKMARCTGLDAASPLFDEGLVPATNQISPVVAKFVDIYHTSSLVATIKRRGHVDYYINGGLYQPFFIEQALSHIAVGYYWDMTILAGPKGTLRCASPDNPVSLNAFRNCCDTRVPFGEYASDTTRGEYYMPIGFDEFFGPFSDAIGNCVSY